MGGLREGRKEGGREGGREEGERERGSYNSLVQKEK